MIIIGAFIHVRIIVLCFDWPIIYNCQQITSDVTEMPITFRRALPKYFVVGVTHNCGIGTGCTYKDTVEGCTYRIYSNNVRLSRVCVNYSAAKGGVFRHLIFFHSDTVFRVYNIVICVFIT